MRKFKREQLRQLVGNRNMSEEWQKQQLAEKQQKLGDRLGYIAYRKQRIMCDPRNRRALSYPWGNLIYIEKKH